MPHLSTYCIQLGSNHPWRVMWRSEKPGPLYWCIQLVAGRSTSGITNASAVGTADEQAEESRHQWNIRHGDRVSPSSRSCVSSCSPACLSFNLTDTIKRTLPLRICIITLIRIRITGLIDGDSNAQQIYSMIALLTCLEALLGVVNACLPVMRPIFTKFSDTKIYSFFASSSSSGSGRSSGGTSSTLSFQKPSRKQHYKIPDSSCTKEMHAWPSLAGSTVTANSTTPGSPHPISTSRPNMHRLSDDKAAHAQVIPKYSTHQPSGDPTYLNIKKLPTTKAPPPSPISKYANTDRERMTMRDSGELAQIVVKRDWDVDVEKGMRL